MKPPPWIDRPRIGRERGRHPARAGLGAWLPLLVVGCLLVAVLLFFGLPLLSGSRPVQGGGGLDVALPAESSDGFGPVPDFTLTDQRGRTVTRADLLGRPWVLATIFTRCTGPCPAVSERMAELQRVLADTDALLVSVTVDPSHDSPEVLAEYAASWGADPERWLFLTGPEAAVDALVREGFWMAVARSAEGEVPPGQAVTHDTRLVAVDAEGERRGWYDQDAPAEIGRLKARMRFLASTAGRSGAAASGNGGAVE